MQKQCARLVSEMANNQMTGYLVISKALLFISFFLDMALPI